MSMVFQVWQSLTQIAKQHLMWRFLLQTLEFRNWRILRLPFQTAQAKQADLDVTLTGARPLQSFSHSRHLHPLQSKLKLFLTNRIFRFQQSKRSGICLRWRQCSYNRIKPRCLVKRVGLGVGGRTGGDCSFRWITLLRRIAPSLMKFACWRLLHFQPLWFKWRWYVRIRFRWRWNLVMRSMMLSCDWR